MLEFDILSEQFFANPYPTLSAMREEAPCYYEPRLEAYVLTRYHDIERVLQDEQFSSQRVSQFSKGAPEHVQPMLDVYNRELERWLLFLDPPVHTRLRSMLRKVFGPGYIPLIEELARETVADAMSDLEATREPDLVRDFALPVPTRILARLLGIESADIELFKQWTLDIFALIGAGVADEESVRRGHRGVTSLREYVLGLIHERRARPRNDAISALAERGPDGSTADEDDIIGLCMTLIVAGHETQTSLITNALHALFMDSKSRDWVNARGGIDEDTVDELMRYDGPVFSLIRRARRDVTVAGQRIREGEFVFNILIAGNRDPRKFNDPDRLDLTRPRSSHLALGTGIHRCVGAPMARKVVREAITQFMRRFPAATAVRDQCVWQRNMSLRGLSSFPVRLRPPQWVSAATARRARRGLDIGLEPYEDVQALTA
jgi:pimeloyl-[acyl-carrier protein] synthase